MWKDLTLKEKAEIMKMSVANGVTDINDIQELYDDSIYAEGGHLYDKAGPLNKAKQQPKYQYGIIEQILRENGVNFRVTSGARKPNQAGNAGKGSAHTYTIFGNSPGAIDIVPGVGSDWNTLFAQMNSPKVREALAAYGLDVLNETNPSIMASTHATGPHLHVGRGIKGQSGTGQMFGGTSFGGGKGSYAMPQYSTAGSDSYTSMMQQQAMEPITLAGSNATSPWLDYISKIGQQRPVTFNTPIGTSSNLANNGQINVGPVDFSNIGKADELMSFIDPYASKQALEYNLGLENNALWNSPYLLFSNHITANGGHLFDDGSMLLKQNAINPALKYVYGEDYEDIIKRRRNWRPTVRSNYSKDERVYSTKQQADVVANTTRPAQKKTRQKQIDSPARRAEEQRKADTAYWQGIREKQGNIGPVVDGIRHPDYDPVKANQVQALREKEAKENQNAYFRRVAEHNVAEGMEAIPWPSTIFGAYYNPNTHWYDPFSFFSNLYARDNRGFFNYNQATRDFYDANPEVGGIGNLIGDFVVPGAATKGLQLADKSTRGLKLARAMNRSLANPTTSFTEVLADIDRFPMGYQFTNPFGRYKLGDVEINNPRLSYRQVKSGTGQNFLDTGYTFTPEETANIIAEEEGLFTPTLKQRLGLEPGYPLDYPMYSQGSLWYGVPSAGTSIPDLIVTAKPLRPANSKSYPIKSYSKSQGRRMSEPVGEVTPENASAYNYTPDYGYRKIGASNPVEIAQNSGEIFPRDWNNPNVYLSPDYSKFSFTTGDKTFDMKLFEDFLNGRIKSPTQVPKSVPTKSIPKNSTFEINTDKRLKLSLGSPSSILATDIWKLTEAEVEAMFGPRAVYWKKMYDVAKNHNFEGKFKAIGEQAEREIRSRFSINREDPDIKIAIDKAKRLYDIPEYRARFERFGTLGDTFIDDALNRIKNMELQGVSEDYKIIGQHGVEGGASAEAHPVSPKVTIKDSDSSRAIQELTQHEVNHAAHGMKYQPEWMKHHNERIRPKPRRESNTPGAKYMNEMDEIVERAKTTVEWADRIRKPGESLNDVLSRVVDDFENLDGLEFAKKYKNIPGDTKSYLLFFEPKTGKKFLQNFVGSFIIGATSMSIANQ